MRHLGRVHGIAISWLHERIGKRPDRCNIDLCYARSEQMSADIYTKAFSDKDKWDHALKLISTYGKDVVKGKDASGYGELFGREASTAVDADLAPHESTS